MVSIRMPRCGIDRTLNGYIFRNREHARAWLSQEGFARGVVLEEVEVGPSMPCPRCGGSGHRQDIKTLRRVTLEDL